MECAAECPAQLDKDAPDLREVAAPAESEVLEAKDATTRITSGLATFELKPKGLTGEALLAHLIVKRTISPSSKTMLAPRHHLDVEVSDGNRDVMAAASVCHLSKRDIMRDAGGKCTNIKLAHRKLDMMGFFKLHSVLINSEDAVERKTNQVMLVKSVAVIQKDKADTARKKKSTAESSLWEMVLAAKIKLAAKDNDANKITKKEICALLMACYTTVADEIKHNKPIIVAMLSENIAVNPERVATDPDSADAIAPVPIPDAVIDPISAAAGASAAAAVSPAVPDNLSSQIRTP